MVYVRSYARTHNPGQLNFCIQSSSLFSLPICSFFRWPGGGENAFLDFQFGGGNFFSSVSSAKKEKKERKRSSSSSLILSIQRDMQ